nr:hypothetical protein Iba_scaffold826926CG0010 [Ipomoea batatas]
MKTPTGQTAQGHLRLASFHLLLDGQETPVCEVNKANRPGQLIDTPMHSQPQETCRNRISGDSSRLQKMRTLTPKDAFTDIAALSRPTATNTPEAKHQHTSKKPDVCMAPSHSCGEPELENRSRRPHLAIFVCSPTTRNPPR